MSSKKSSGGGAKSFDDPSTIFSDYTREVMHGPKYNRPPEPPTTDPTTWRRSDPDRPWLLNGLSPRDKTWRTELRRKVYTRDDFRCQSCGHCPVPDDVVSDPEFTYDGRHNIIGLTLGHIVPRSHGGKWTTDNIKAQCPRCNNRLADNVWTEFWEPGMPVGVPVDLARLQAEQDARQQQADDAWAQARHEEWVQRLTGLFPDHDRSDSGDQTAEGGGDEGGLEGPREGAGEAEAEGAEGGERPG